VKITNNYSEKVYWRAFKDSDTSYVIGLHQGIIDAGGEDEWIDDSFPNVKVEAKLGDIVFSTKVLATPGQSFTMQDDLIVTSQGKLIKGVVSLQPTGGTETVTSSDILFVDTTGFDQPVTRELTSRASTAFTSSSAFENTTGHEQTWSVNGKFGGGVKGDGGELSGEVSGGYEDKMINELKHSYGQAVEQQWEQSWTDTLTFPARKFNVLEVQWTVTFDKGTASYLARTAEYRVVRSITPSVLKPTSYDSAADLPPEYAAAWTLATKR
jgi:hypothetical protein